ncbi:hypothetical protein L3X38_016808 [Prunus dulcis]|uniref:Uncharacterized protein n=1 Tax=Prunus dulcis TaxID=3755 RepID=A0AAD4Z8K5_PRUDU|nr:hypothetical protein L3X38_016808 [Prunus dulcis]
MSLSAWLCTSSTKKMLVKIVHPGGHVELHDSPLLAAELMLRNPRCCVAHPHIFQQPWAIVAPDTMLRLGQKYYVVPISTIRKLQRLSLKHSPTSVHEMQSNITPSKEDQKSDDIVSNYCNWFIMNKNSTKSPYACTRHSNDAENNVDMASNHAGSTTTKGKKKEEGCFSQDNCFDCFLMGTKVKEHGDDLKEETKSSSTSISSSEIETKALTRRRSKDSTRNLVRRPPKRFPSPDHWQPSLESINEE